MTLSQLSWLVLNATTNDYEDIEAIQVDVDTWCAEYGIVYSHLAVVDTLVELIDCGFVSAYSLSTSGPPIKLEAASKRDFLQRNTHFLATASGREVASKDLPP